MLFIVTLRCYLLFSLWLTFALMVYKQQRLKQPLSRNQGSCIELYQQCTVNIVFFTCTFVAGKKKTQSFLLKNIFDDAVKGINFIKSLYLSTQLFLALVPKHESSSKTSTSALLTTLKPLIIWITTNWKILKDMGIPDHLTCLLRNLYAGQEATVRTQQWNNDWFQIGKGVHQGCILSPCLFNLYAEYIMRNARLDEAQAGIKIAERNIINLRQADATTLMAESEEELKSLLMKVKEESKKLA